MKNMKKRLFGLVMAGVMMMPLAVTASAEPAEDAMQVKDLAAHYMNKSEGLTEEEAQIMVLASGYENTRTGTVPLIRNVDGTQGNRITKFTASTSTALFRITSAANTETFNAVCLDMDGNAMSIYYNSLTLGNYAVGYDLIPGEEYTFQVSSNDCPSRGCNGTYELQY